MSTSARSDSVPSRPRTISHSYTPLESVKLGQSALEAIAQQAEKIDARRVFLIASNTLSTKTNEIEKIASALGERCCGTFSGIRAHTPRVDVLTVVAKAREARADLLISIGGGSIIDATKAVQLCLNEDISTEAELLEYGQFSDGSRGAKVGTDGKQIIDSARIKHIAVPTTLSGAEYSNNAGVTDTEKGLKEGYRWPDLYPRHIIYDPALAVHTPQWLWLSTALRSVDHAVEGFCSADAHPYLEGQYLHALRLFSSSLPAMKSNPDDLEARSLNQQAIWLACCALGKVSHGASHGIGYILGSMCGVPHGYTSCVMLPAVLQWNEKGNENRQKPIAGALGQPHCTASQAVKKLVVDLGLPSSLREVGVREDQLQAISKLAANHKVVKKNPRPIDSLEDVAEILQLAW